MTARVDGSWFRSTVPYAIFLLVLALVGGLAGPWAYGLLVGGEPDTSKPYTELSLVDPPNDNGFALRAGQPTPVTVEVTSHEAAETHYDYEVECLGPEGRSTRCGAGGSLVLSPGESETLTVEIDPRQPADEPVSTVVISVSRPAGDPARDPLRLRLHLSEA